MLKYYIIVITCYNATTNGSKPGLISVLDGLQKNLHKDTDRHKKRHKHRQRQRQNTETKREKNTDKDIVDKSDRWIYKSYR